MSRRRAVVTGLMVLALVIGSVPLAGLFQEQTHPHATDVTLADDTRSDLSLSAADTGSSGPIHATSAGDGSLRLSIDEPSYRQQLRGQRGVSQQVFSLTNTADQRQAVSIQDQTETLGFIGRLGADATRFDDGGRLVIGPGETVPVTVSTQAAPGQVTLPEEITVTATPVEAGSSPGQAGARAFATEPSVGDGGDGDGGDGDGDDGDGGDGDGDDGDDGDGDDGTDDDGGENETDRDVQTRLEGDSLVATGTATSGDTVSFDTRQLPTEQSQTQSVTVESLTIGYTAETTLNTTVSTATDASQPAPPSQSVLRYITVSHPNTPDSAIDNATVRFVLDSDEAEQTRTLDVLRYDPSAGAWETAATEVSFVGTTDDGAVYEAQLDQLSLLAIVEAVRSSIVTTPAAERPVNATLIGGNSTYPTETYRIYRTKSLSATWWDERATRNADDAAAVIREELRLDLEQAAKDTLFSKFVAFADNALQSLLHISGISKLLAARDILTKSGEFLGSFGPAVQQKAVAIHVDPGTDSYDKLQTNLRQLEENTAAFKQADQNGNAERKQQLLEEREQLLRETYLLLPRYLTDVHSSVVGNAAGMEDPRAYSVIRTNVESLRLQLKLDYKWVTTELENAPDTRLPRETSMPTHGWVAFGRATVYDTMDHSDDYVVLKLNASQAVQADKDVSVTVEGANVTGMETLVRSTRPDRPRTTTGRSFGDNGNATTATIELTDPEETMYVVVRPDELEGPIRISAAAPSAPVRFTVAERAGPDIQRPHADLITGPDPVTLRDGDVVYPTNTSDTTLTWELWDDKTRTENIEYRFRVDRGSGFTSWTAWQSAPESGQVSPALAYTDGITRVQLQVRDSIGRTTVRNADVVVSEGAPQTTVAAPDDPTSPEAYVRVLPERRIERVELQYRRVGNQTWTDWKTVNDTRGFGRITVPIQGEVIVRARATGLDGATGGWDTDQVTYFPPDTTPPTINLTDAPPQRPTQIDGTVQQRRVTQDASTTLRWNLTDDETAAAAVEYRVRVDGGAWSAWTATSDGVASTSVSLARNGTTVELAARDAAGNIATQELRLRRDTTAPTVQLDVTSDITGGVVDPQVSEPIQRIELQYRAAGSQTWQDWSTIGDDSTTTVPLDETGQFEARARATDTAGNVGPWSDPALFNSLSDDQGQDLPGPGDPFTPGGDGGSGDGWEGDIPGDAADYINATGDVYILYNALIDEIDGELLIDMYVVSRQGREIPISSIRLTEERNQTVRADLPRNLTAGSKLRVEVSGNGTVRLESLRAIGARPSLPTIIAPQEPVEVGSTVSLTVEGDWPGESYIERYEWDRDDDGTFDVTTVEPRLNVTYQTPGPRNVTVQVTDVFGETSANNTTIQVNAQPEPSFDVPNAVQTGAEVRLQGGDSRDPDGSIEVFEWDLDGDGTFERTGVNTTTAYDDDGNYTVTLRVIDEYGDAATVNRTLRVLNRPPSLEWEYSPQRPVVDEAVTFDAGASTDPDGTVSTVEWDFDGDGTFEQEGTSVTTRFDTAGSHSVSVRVTDDDGTSVNGSQVIMVNALPEPAIAATTPARTLETVTLNGSESVDPDGDIASYEWDLDNDGAFEQNGAVVERSYADDGEYTVQLRVTDTGGATTTTNATIVVTNRPPRANLTYAPAVPTVTETVVFDAGASMDRDGSIDTIAWDLDDDGSFEQTGATVEYAFAESGDHRVRVRVTDDDGATNTTARQVHVNVPPTPAVDTNGPVQTDETVRIDAQESTDPDGQISRYEWDLDDDGTFEADGTTVERSYADDGNYTIRLRVTDNEGEAVTTTANVTVRNRPPNVTAALLTAQPVAGTETNLSATANDPDGQIERYSWRFESAGEFSDESSRVTNIYETFGNYTATVRVTDDDGATATATVELYVNAPPEPSFDVPDAVQTGEDVRLNGGSSLDPDGSIATFEWDLDNDGAFERTGVNTTTSYADDGNYTIRLRVVDNAGTARTTTQNLTVRNRAPNLTVSITPSPAVTGREILLNATESTDPDGQITNLTWDVGADGTVERTGESERLVLSEPGPREIRIRATDDDGATTTVVRTIEVNAPPEPWFSLPDQVRTNETINLDATSSDDEDGQIVEYRWDIGNTGSIDNRSVQSTVRFQDDGDYQIRLVVIDDQGAKRSLVKNITVLNRPPSVRINASATTIRDPVQFEAVANDSDGEIAAIAWDLDTNGTVSSDGDGATYNDATGPTASYRYRGDYTRNVSVQVTDDDGATSNVTETIALPVPPVARPSVPENVTTFEPITLNGTASQDRDGRIVEYRWNISGMPTYTNETATHQFSDNGNPTVGLTVVDDAGLTNTTRVRVNVTNRPPNVTITGPQEVRVGESITVSSDVSDRDGSVERYNWTIDGQPVSSDETLQVAFDSAGSETITLRVTDDDGASAIDSLTVTVTENESESSVPTVDYLPEATSELNLPGNESAIAIGGFNEPGSPPTDDIYTLSDGRFISAVAVDQSEIEWNYTLPQSTSEQEVFPILTGGDQIAAGYRINSSAYRLIALTEEGQVSWRTTLQTPMNDQLVRPIAAENGILVTAFISGDTARLVGIDPETGVVAWDRSLPSDVDLDRDVTDIRLEEYPFEEPVVVRLDTDDGRAHLYRVQASTGQISEPISVAQRRPVQVQVGSGGQEQEVPIVVNSVSGDDRMHVSEIDVDAWERVWSTSLPVASVEDARLEVAYLDDAKRAGQTRYLYIGTESPFGDDRLHAIDRQTGERRLTVNTDRGYIDMTAIDEDGVAYVQTDFRRLKAIDPEAGRVVYNQSISGRPKYDQRTDQLLIETGPGLVALDGGNVAWQYDIPSPLFNPYGYTPVGTSLANDRVYVSYNTSIVALDTETGYRLWRTSVASIEPFPLLSLHTANSGDHIVAVGQKQLFGLSPDGNITWDRTDPSTSFGFLPLLPQDSAATSSTVFVRTVENSSQNVENVTLRSYNAETGQERWAANIGNTTSVFMMPNQSREYAVFRVSRPVEDDSRYPRSEESLLAINRQTGEVVTANAPEYPFRVLAIDSENRYLEPRPAYGEDSLAAINRTTGDAVWALPLDGSDRAIGIHDEQGNSYLVVTVDGDLYIKRAGEYDRWYWWAHID